jgi:chemotaxis protein MotB
MSRRGNHNTNQQPVVIRKEEAEESGHHGGQWKVAYADFVTAMMAFFLLMWLINATTEAQRRGLADYFSRANIFAHQMSGSGKPFGGKTPYEAGAFVSDEGSARVIRGHAEAIPDPDDNDADTPAEPRPPHVLGDEVAVETDAAGPADHTSGNARTTINPNGAGAAVITLPPAAIMKDNSASVTRQAPERKAQQAETAVQQEETAFRNAAEQIRQAIRNDPELAELSRQLAIDETPEGLRIQILDEENQPMFATGDSQPNRRALQLLRKISPILQHLPEEISIAGYTDAAPYHGGEKTNWELSTERANAARRILQQEGIPEARFRTVIGHADRDLLLPADPLAAANRRIAIVLLRQAQGKDGVSPRAILAPQVPAPSLGSMPHSRVNTTQG